MLEIYWEQFPKLVLNQDSRIKGLEVEYFRWDSINWDPDWNPPYMSCKVYF